MAVEPKSWLSYGWSQCLLSHISSWDLSVSYHLLCQFRSIAVWCKFYQFISPDSSFAFSTGFVCRTHFLGTFGSLIFSAALVSFRTTALWEFLCSSLGFCYSPHTFIWWRYLSLAAVSFDWIAEYRESTSFLGWLTFDLFSGPAQF